MSNSIEDIIKSVRYPRCVGIEITNKCRSRVLTDPEFYIASGKVHTSHSDTINPGEQRVWVFRNRTLLVRSVVGVLSYRSGNTQISLLFPNPSDGNIEYALYVPDGITTTNEDLYETMRKQRTELAGFTKKALGKDDSSLNITKGGIHVHVSATMSDKHKPILKIDIRDAC